MKINFYFLFCFNLEFKTQRLNRYLYILEIAFEYNFYFLVEVFLIIYTNVILLIKNINMLKQNLPRYFLGNSE